MSSVAPVVVFVYNRLEHTKNVLISLDNNSMAQQSRLFIFADAPVRVGQRKKVEEVQRYLDIYARKSTFKKVTIIKALEHKGLAKSVIEGVSSVIEKYKKVIVVEDDLMVSKDFLEYMNQALAYYMKDKKIWAISGYTEPLPMLRNYKQDVFMGYRGNSWGWATWLNRWKQVDWEVKDYKYFKYNYFARDKFNRGGNDLSKMLDKQKQGELDSWAIRWCYAQSKLNTLTVYPKETRVRNCGMDGSGVHCGKTHKFDVNMKEEHRNCHFIKTKINRRLCKAFRQYMGPSYRELLKSFILDRLK